MRTHVCSASSGLQQRQRLCQRPAAAASAPSRHSIAHPRPTAPPSMCPSSSPDHITRGGSLISHAAPAATPVAAAHPTWDTGLFTEQGLRDGMEDCVKMHNAGPGSSMGMFCAVFDGHGGPEAAQWLSQELYKYLEKRMSQDASASSDKLKELLTAAFEEADADLLNHLKSMGEDVLTNAGSTGTVVMVRDSDVVVANIGDSSCFILRKGAPVELTTPHRVYGSDKEVKKETQRINATGAWIYDGRVCNILAVSRAFGDWEFKGEGRETLLPRGVQRKYWSQKFADSKTIKADPVIVTPAFSQTKLTSEDELLIVASDGMWDVVPPADVFRFAKNKLKLGQSAQEVAAGLADMSLKRKSTDNISVMVIDFKGQQYWMDENSSGGQQNWLGGKLGGMFGGKK